MSAFPDNPISPNSPPPVRHTDPMTDAKLPGKAIKKRPTRNVNRQLSPLNNQRKVSSGKKPPPGMDAIVGPSKMRPAGTTSSLTRPTDMREALFKSRLNKNATSSDPLVDNFTKHLTSGVQKKGGEGEFKVVYPVDENGAPANPNTARWAAAVSPMQDELRTEIKAYQALKDFVRVPQVKDNKIHSTPNSNVMFVQWIPGETLHTKFFSQKQGLSQRLNQFLNVDLRNSDHSTCSYEEKLKNAKEDLVKLRDFSQKQGVFLKDMQLQFDKRTGHIYLIDPEIRMPRENPELHQKNLNFLNALIHELDSLK